MQNKWMNDNDNKWVAELILGLTYYKIYVNLAQPTQITGWLVSDSFAVGYVHNLIAVLSLVTRLHRWVIRQYFVVSALAAYHTIRVTNLGM